MSFDIECMTIYIPQDVGQLQKGTLFPSLTFLLAKTQNLKKKKINKCGLISSMIRIKDRKHRRQSQFELDWNFLVRLRIAFLMYEEF